MSGRVSGAAAALLGALAAGAPLAAQPAAVEASFVLRMGADTFAVESFARGATRLEGAIAGRAIGRMTYSVALGEAASAHELALSAWRPGVPETSAALQQVQLELRGDSAIAEIITPAGAQTQRLGARAGALPYVNPSFALVEQILMRARALGGATVEVPLFMVQGGQSIPAIVTWAGADSAVVRIVTSELHVRAGADGTLLGGAVPAQNLTITRVDRALPTQLAVEEIDYSAPPGAPYTAEEVVVETAAGHRLAGTFTRPAAPGRVPAVVTITGSGAQERDQSLPTLPGYRPFREIADTLARRGIAVLRLDDRGTGASTGDFAAATSADFADDVRAALAYLRARPDVDARRLALVGHSEGALVAPMVAATDSALRAIVLLAGPAQTGREIIAYQQRFAIDRAVTSTGTARDSAFAAAQAQLQEIAARQPWIRYFLDHDPLATARRVRQPAVLVLHGETDRQVTVDQAQPLGAAFGEAGNRDVTVRVFPAVNHLLLQDADGDPARYSTITERQVVREVLGSIADWLADRMF